MSLAHAAARCVSPLSTFVEVAALYACCSAMTAYMTVVVILPDSSVALGRVSVLRNPWEQAAWAQAPQCSVILDRPAHRCPQLSQVPCEARLNGEHDPLHKNCDSFYFFFKGNQTDILIRAESDAMVRSSIHQSHLIMYFPPSARTLPTTCKLHGFSRHWSLSLLSTQQPDIWQGDGNATPASRASAYNYTMYIIML